MAEGNEGEYYLVEISGLDDSQPRQLRGERVTPLDGANILTVYFMRRRDVLIAELREIDRLLGRRQTVPERER